VIALMADTFTPVHSALGGPPTGTRDSCGFYLFSLPCGRFRARRRCLPPCGNQANEVGYKALAAVIPIALAVTLFMPLLWERSVQRDDAERAVEHHPYILSGSESRARGFPSSRKTRSCSPIPGLQ